MDRLVVLGVYDKCAAAVVGEAELGQAVERALDHLREVERRQRRDHRTDYERERDRVTGHVFDGCDKRECDRLGVAADGGSAWIGIADVVGLDRAGGGAAVAVSSVAVVAGEVVEQSITTDFLADSQGILGVTCQTSARGCSVIVGANSTQTGAAGKGSAGQGVAGSAISRQGACAGSAGVMAGNAGTDRS